MRTREFRRWLAVTSFLLLALSVIAAAPDSAPQHKTIRAEDGLNIVCEVRGKGDTALVFLHGWCGDHDYWKNQVEVFATNYRVIALDQAGHGESGKNRQHWTVSSLAGDVESVAKSLDLKRIILVGHSMGGPVALMAAKRLPGKVIGIIAVDTLQNAEFKRPEEMTKKLLADFEADFPGTLRGAFPGLLNEKTDPELKKWLLNKAEAQNQTMAIGLMRDLTGLDEKALLKDAKVPIRCINSGGGYQFFVPTAIDINKKYADYDGVFIQEVGHYPMLEKPEEFNQKLRDALKEFAGKK